MLARLSVTLLMLAPAAGFAQSAESDIQDNSLLTEEAYNQERAVVQHINFFQRDRRTHQWVYTFTQEWPVPAQTHQLSYTVPMVGGVEADRGARVGDVALNYRYQLLGDSEATWAATPRFTLILPTGDWRHGEGNGALGYNGAIAISYAPKEAWNFHFDVGEVVTPQSHGVTHTWTLGNNIVWRPMHGWNAMLETWFQRDDSENSLVVSPAMRWAYNFANGLQIVPGVGFPIGIGPSAGERAVILYLSFEHPFRR